MFGNKSPISNNVILDRKNFTKNTVVQKAPNEISFPKENFEPLNRLEPIEPINNFYKVNFGSFLYNPQTGE